MQSDERPDDLDDTERPRPGEEAVDARKEAPTGKKARMNPLPCRSRAYMPIMNERAHTPYTVTAVVDTAPVKQRTRKGPRPPYPPRRIASGLCVRL
jgi:hypothetical protein